MELTSIQCSRLQPQSLPRYGSGTRSMLFPQVFAGWAPTNTRRMAVIRLVLMLLEAMLVMFSTREGYKVIALLLKPSLGLFGLMGQHWVLLPHPGSATSHLIAAGDYHTLQHIQVHFGVDFQADFEDVRWHDVALTWNHTKYHNRNQKLCFHHPGHVPVIRGNPAMVLDIVHLVLAEVLFVWKEQENVWFLGMLQFVEQPDGLD